MTNEIESHLNTVNDMFNPKDPVYEWRHRLNTLPEGGAGLFTDRFAIGGKYFAWMESKVGECQKAFSEAIDNSLTHQLTRIDFQGEYGLGDVRTFFENLDRIIEQTLLLCPERLPTLDLNELDFEPLYRAEKNIWLKITGRKKRAVETHRGKLIKDYRQLIIGHEGIYPKMRNYFLRAVLEAVRAKLGFQVHSDGPTIKQQLDRIQVNLQHCDQTLKEDYEFYIQPPQFVGVKIVTNNPQNSIETDAESLSAQIVDDASHPALFVEDGHSITMDTFFNKEHEEMKLWMIETYRDLALRRINQTAETLATTKTQELLNVTDNDIEDLARRSNPYQEFVPEYQPFVLEPRTKIIVGHDPTDYRLNNLQMNLGFDRTGNSSVDHFLFFYEEEAGFAPDDLAVYELLKHHFESSLGIYGHWTHQHPNFYDITFQQKKITLQGWCKMLARLVPEIWANITTNAFDDLFRHENGRCVFEYDIDDELIAKLDLSDPLNGIAILCREENNTAYDHFFQSVKDGFTKLDREKIHYLISEMLIKSVEDNEEYENLAAMFRSFLEQVYSTDDN